jgi:hypothetical protein
MTDPLEDFLKKEKNQEPITSPYLYPPLKKSVQQQHLKGKKKKEKTQYNIGYGQQRR